jgi:peptide/nickel transport system substrate-binding protein
MSDDVPAEGFGLTRRELLERSAAAALAVGAGGLLAEAASAATPKPKRGGTLRVALIGGGASSDNLDPHTPSGSPELQQAFRQNVYSKLTDLAADGSYQMQLAESMTPDKTATVWQVKLKPGVVFHDGSPLTADDVIYTLRRILDPKNNYGSAAANISMIDPKQLKKVSKTELIIRLKTPWVDLPSAVGQRFVSIVKEGAKAPFTVKNTNGTGAFKLTGWTPGEKFSYAASKHYFESGKPYVDSMTMVGIPDPVARVNALVSRQVDAINDVPAAQVPVVTGAGRQILAGKAGGWIPIYMDTQAAPFKDVRVRQAMKLLMNRPQAQEAAIGKYGLLGNDIFARWDPLYDSALPQRKYDPERAAALLKQAGQQDTEFVLHASSVQSELTPQALVLAQAAKKVGVKLTVSNDPADSYWDKVYGNVTFAFSSWGYRPFFAQWLQSFVSWNAVETKWADESQKKASRLVYKAAATVDPGRRKELAWAAQKLLWDDGGYVIAFFKEPIDGLSKNVHGLKPHPFPFLGWYRFWDAWLT